VYPITGKFLKQLEFGFALLVFGPSDAVFKVSPEEFDLGVRSFATVVFSC
jgi:hypothetical protein